MNRLLVFILILLCSPAYASEIYSWKTDDGVFAFTDDVKNVPKKYADTVEQREFNSLNDYGHFTPIDEKAAVDYEERLLRRIEHLRALNYKLSHELRLERSSSPVVIETVPVKRDTSEIQNVQVIRRGDDILFMIKPRNRVWSLDDTVDPEEFNK